MCIQCLLLALSRWIVIKSHIVFDYLSMSIASQNPIWAWIEKATNMLNIRTIIASICFTCIKIMSFDAFVYLECTMICLGLFCWCFLCGLARIDYHVTTVYDINIYSHTSWYIDHSIITSLHIYNRLLRHAYKKNQTEFQL